MLRGFVHQFLPCKHLVFSHTIRFCVARSFRFYLSNSPEKPFDSDRTKKYIQTGTMCSCNHTLGSMDTQSSGSPEKPGAFFPLVCHLNMSTSGFSITSLRRLLKKRKHLQKLYIHSNVDIFKTLLLKCANNGHYLVPLVNTPAFCSKCCVSRKS